MTHIPKIIYKVGPGQLVRFKLEPASAFLPETKWSQNMICCYFLMFVHFIFTHFYSWSHFWRSESGRAFSAMETAISPRFYPN